MSDVPGPPNPREIIERYEPDLQIRSILRSVARGGSWAPPADVAATTVMGEIRLDLRDAELLVDGTTIHARAIMGQIDIIVPREVELEIHGSVVLGEVRCKASFATPRDDDEFPLVVVECSGAMGFIEIRNEEERED